MNHHFSHPSFAGAGDASTPAAGAPRRPSAAEAQRLGDLRPRGAQRGGRRGAAGRLCPVFGSLDGWF